MKRWSRTVCPVCRRKMAKFNLKQHKCIPSDKPKPTRETCERCGKEYAATYIFYHKCKAKTKGGVTHGHY